jgi:hypothetical protein
MMAECSPSASASPGEGPRPSGALADALARLAAAADVRAAGAAVTERRFRCAWDRPALVRFLRERWEAFGLEPAIPAAPAVGTSSAPPVPVVISPAPVPVTLWPTPRARVRGRKATLQAVFGPVGMAAAGPTVDDAAPPGAARLALCGRIEAEVEAEAAWGETGGAGEGGQGQGKKTGTWSWEVEVAQLDLSARPDGGCDGTVRALAQVWPWVERLAEQVTAWTWTPERPAPEPTAASPAARPDQPAVRLPRRGAFRRKWQAAWNLAKPLVAAGKGDVFIGHVLRRHGLPHEPRTVRRIIQAGQAGLLDG